MKPPAFFNCVDAVLQLNSTHLLALALNFFRVFRVFRGPDVLIFDDQFLY